MDDNQIIALFFSRDEEAIRQTDAAYGRKLHHLADNILHNDQDAEESINDTYMKTWDSIPPQRPAHFFAYIAKICRNLALKKLDWGNARKRNAQIVELTQEMESCIPDKGAEYRMTAQELGRLLDAFLRTLTPKNRDVFLRRYWFADTIGEIAVRYSITESAVQMRLNRSRDKLAEYLAKEGVQI